MASTDEVRARAHALIEAGVHPGDLDGALALVEKVFHRIESADSDEIEERYGAGDFTRGMAVLAVAEIFKAPTC